MAKISARGAHEIARHTAKDGTQFLRRSDGVILCKYYAGMSWKVFNLWGVKSNDEAWERCLHWREQR